MAPLLKLLTLLSLTTLISAQAQAQAGTLFITAPCTSDTDCASSCCGFNSGKCAGPVIAQERDGGCGFGNPTPNDNAAVAFRGGQTPSAAPAAPSAPVISVPEAELPSAPGAETPEAPEAVGGGSDGSGNTAGTQFITGPCTSDTDCASRCCGFRSGKCAGPVVAQERDGGCGFGDAVSNDDAARELVGRGVGRRGLRGVGWVG